VRARAQRPKRSWNCWKTLDTPANSETAKININAVCEGALAYMTFPDGASAEAFVADCKEGKHPEVIEKYKADMHLDGAAI
jgi:ABC-type molybdate transport system substrate-binding protein